MTGLTERPDRPPHENRQARSTDARQRWRSAFADARGAAAQDRASGFGRIQSRYAAQLAAARAHLSGAELDAALAAIRSEQRAAEATLRLELAGVARQRRAAILAALKAEGSMPATAYDVLRQPPGAAMPPRRRRRFQVRLTPLPRAPP